MSLQKERVEGVFAHLAEGRVERFFEHLAPEVCWTVMGSHVFAGTYHGREALRRSSFLPILNDLNRGGEMRLRAVHVVGEVAVIELETLPRAGSQKPCAMSYCWVTRFQDDQIAEVRAYPDPAMIHHLMNDHD